MLSDLASCLEAFNRKERYWVVRNALGDQDRPTPLAVSFRELVGVAIGRDIPEHAWWALDFHIDWLFGALFYRQNIEIRSGINPHVSDASGGIRYAIQGSQQDFDFLIAFDKTLVMIEAKATGGWDISQYESKCKRLQALQDPHFTVHDLDMFFVLLSPEKPPETLSGLLPNCVKQRHVNLWFDNPDRDFVSIGRESISKNDRWAIKRQKKPQ